MYRLLEFLKHKGSHLLFILLEIVAILLLLKGSNYHNSVVLSSANILTGKATEVLTTANTYLGLRETNVELMQKNAELEKEVLKLKSTIERLTVDTLVHNKLIRDSLERAFPYEYITAKVVGNSLFSKSTFITIDKGSANGIRSDMGVVAPNGVVGVITSVGKHYSKVVPLINNAFSISCKIGNSQHVGTLTWDGRDYRHTLLTHLPKHVGYHIGDTVCTSGYSAIFPENIFVGVVEEEGASSDDNFYALRVKINTDFSSLKDVYVILNYDREERKKLETTKISHPTDSVID